jgi:integrase/recombinase XerC
MRPDDEVEPCLPAHLNELRKENLSPRTVRERRLTVLRLTRHLGHPVADVTRDELAAWQDSQAALQPASMHNAIVHVSQYLGWLAATERRHDNPSVALIRPKHDRRGIPHPMSDADITRALASAEQPVHAWIGLGAFCGLRCMEMATLTAEKIVTGANPYLRILGKGGKERVVALPVALLEELLRDFPHAGHLFERMDGKGGPPSAGRVSERVNKHLHSVGIEATAHALRHRFGTKLYEATNDPFLVAEAMGHASTDTTRGYVQLVNTKAAVAIEAISHLAA